MQYQLKSQLLPHANSIQLWMDQEHKFIAANKSSIRLFGYLDLDDLLGKGPENIKCQAADCADVFITQNDLVFNRKNQLIIFDIHPYADNSIHTFITTKRPLYNAIGEIFAVECQCESIKERDTNKFLCRLLAIDQVFYGKNAIQASYVTGSSSQYSLAPREEECMFYLIRGYSMKQIARFLQLSPKTVESYLDNVKSKFGCSTKQEMIEFAIGNGLLPFIPQSLIHNRNLSTILID